MASLPKFRLSEELASIGNPVDGTPFAIDDVCHDIWDKATRAVEEKACGFAALYPRATS